MWQKTQKIPFVRMEEPQISAFSKTSRKKIFVIKNL